MVILNIERKYLFIGLLIIFLVIIGGYIVSEKIEKGKEEVLRNKVLLKESIKVKEASANNNITKADSLSKEGEKYEKKIKQNKINLEKINTKYAIKKINILSEPDSISLFLTNRYQ